MLLGVQDNGMAEDILLARSLVTRDSKYLMFLGKTDKVFEIFNPHSEIVRLISHSI